MHETWWSILCDPAHWIAEIVMMIVFDGLIGAMLLPFIGRHWAHHKARDKREGK